MSTFTERLTEAISLTATAESASRDASTLSQQVKQRIKNNEEILELAKQAAKDFGVAFVQPPLDLELARMQTRLDDLWERARQARIRLAILEHEMIESAAVKLISSNAKGAQIAVRYLRDDGKKLSFTRHVQLTAQGYEGLSVISKQKVTYRLTAAVAEAA